jgi:large subunit ribosomal protein L29
MKISEIKGLSGQELQARAKELRAESLNLRIQQQSGRLERPSRLTEIRKDIARIETVLSEQRNKKASA